ncbi:DUF3048 domain-containing protein [Candidatus Saccharibacteria bacterium]|nr:DUF3048 domain-containing protein [Candidatus Saccharibacteria bacterium]
MNEKLRNLVARFGTWLRTNKRKILLTLWFFLFVALGIAYPLVSKYYSLPFLDPLGSGDEGSPIVLSESTKKEVSHPITGVFYTAEEESSWVGRRPLGVMVDNHYLARPYQFGLQGADIIYEAVAEGGITRFLALFHSQNVGKIGPVRSARVYYMDFALEFPAYYAHVGGASTPGPANIHTYIAKNDVLSLNQFRLGSATYTYGGDVRFPGGGVLSHIHYSSTDKLSQAGELLYPGTNKMPAFERWKFKSDAPFAARPKEQKFSFNFWYFPAYQVGWSFEPKTNSYLRWQGGEVQTDKATGKQLFAKNVALVYMRARSAGDGTSHRLYTTTGEGDAVLYQDGVEVSSTWRRSNLSSRMKFFKRGTNEELELNRGLTWIEVLPK